MSGRAYTVGRYLGLCFGHVAGLLTVLLLPWLLILAHRRTIMRLRQAARAAEREADDAERDLVAVIGSRETLLTRLRALEMVSLAPLFRSDPDAKGDQLPRFATVQRMQAMSVGGLPIGDRFAVVVGVGDPQVQLSIHRNEIEAEDQATLLNVAAQVWCSRAFDAARNRGAR